MQSYRVGTRAGRLRPGAVKPRRRGTARPARLAAVALGLLLAACGPATLPTTIEDPYEAQNRQTHEFNLALDRTVLRPVSRAYGSTIPRPVRRAVTNFAGNLGQPGVVLNDLLQLNIEDAVHNSFRFVINTTIGLGGIFDPATDFGIEQRDSDFGETMHVWGAPEGAYIELPVLGPSTERDAFGRLVDIAIDPLGNLLPRAEEGALRVARVLARFDDRYTYSEFVDEILYQSADSYAQSRLLYLQNRRFNLQGGKTEQYLDPYEDPYADTYADPYAAE